jgi:hypothetical protein
MHVIKVKMYNQAGISPETTIKTYKHKLANLSTSYNKNKNYTEFWSEISRENATEP